MAKLTVERIKGQQDRAAGNNHCPYPATTLAALDWLAGYGADPAANKYDLRISETQRRILINALSRECTANDGRMRTSRPVPEKYAEETSILRDMLDKDLEAGKAKLRVKSGELEFENGRLVKVGGQRPEYMSGHKLIQLCRELGELVHAHETTMHDLTA